MGCLVSYMYADIGAPLSETLFASDAQGAEDEGRGGDPGGWGLVATDVSTDVARRCLLVGLKPGRSATKLSGDYAGPRRPDLPIARGVPFTQLPLGLFDDAITTWSDVAAGRWRYADHITLGETRSIVFLAFLLSACAGAYRKKYLALEDNTSCAGAVTKGRSPSPLLNFLLRRKSASLLAAEIQLLLPWVETSLQPFAGLSRLQMPGAETRAVIRRSASGIQG